MKAVSMWWAVVSLKDHTGDLRQGWWTQGSQHHCSFSSDFALSAQGEFCCWVWAFNSTACVDHLLNSIKFLPYLSLLWPAAEKGPWPCQRFSFTVRICELTRIFVYVSHSRWCRSLQFSVPIASWVIWPWSSACNLYDILDLHGYDNSWGICKSWTPFHGVDSYLMAECWLQLSSQEVRVHTCLSHWDMNVLGHLFMYHVHVRNGNGT